MMPMLRMSDRAVVRGIAILVTNPGDLLGGREGKDARLPVTC
jgi:hypothetical protein